MASVLGQGLTSPAKCSSSVTTAFRPPSLYRSESDYAGASALRGKRLPRPSQASTGIWGGHLAAVGAHEWVILNRCQPGYNDAVRGPGDDYMARVGFGS